MEVKISKKRVVKIKELTVDESDQLLDLVFGKLQEDGKGGFKMEAPMSTMTKFIRIGVDGDTSDKFIKTLSMKDRTNIFTEMQKTLNQGEETPSK